jgi:hypothetical protein
MLFSFILFNLSTRQLFNLSLNTSKFRICTKVEQKPAS